MIEHLKISDKELHLAIKSGKVNFGGNRRLKIYGHLHCNSGKRMKKDNRVFFANEDEAIATGYRPCGHCMSEEYQAWRESTK